MAIRATISRLTQDREEGDDEPAAVAAAGPSVRRVAASNAWRNGGNPSASPDSAPEDTAVFCRHDRAVDNRPSAPFVDPGAANRWDDVASASRNSCRSLSRWAANSRARNRLIVIIMATGSSELSTVPWMRASSATQLVDVGEVVHGVPSVADPRVDGRKRVALENLEALCWPSGRLLSPAAVLLRRVAAGFEHVFDVDTEGCSFFTSGIWTMPTTRALFSL